MLIALVIALAAIGFVVIFHYEALHLVAANVPKLKLSHRPRLMMVIGATLMVHLIEICVFALLFFIVETVLGLGELKGATTGDFWDYIYFSSTTYTTLGFGDVHPVGPLRILVGLEGLVGLVLITWSASHTYIILREYW